MEGLGLTFSNSSIESVVRGNFFVYYVQLKSGLPKVAGQNTVRTDLQLSVN